MPNAELQAIRNRMRSVEGQIEALEMLKHPQTADHLRLAALHTELARLTLAEGVAGGDLEPKPELTNVVAIR